MNHEQLAHLVYEALETELGGVEVYEAAIGCAVDAELKREWHEYLEQTRRHVEIVENLCLALELDASKETAGRQIVRLKAQALVAAMKMAKNAGDPQAAEIVAAECVVDAETSDHQNWELLGEAADAIEGHHAKRALIRACDLVEDEEDEHLYHTMGWARELRIKALGLPAVLPPPEEEKHVRTAIGAARARLARTEML